MSVPSHGGRQTIGVVAMTDLRKVWKARHLMIVAVFAVPGVLMLLQQRGYLVDSAVMPAMSMSSQAVVAPDFSLQDLDGNVRRLKSFHGRVVLLTFWATWCPPCLTEIPSMEALYQAYKDHGFEVVAVASDVQGAEAIQPFVTQRDLSFTTLLDATGQVTRLYGVTSLPTTYLLDRQGRLVSVAIGSHDWAKAGSRELIMSLLDTAQQAAMPRGAEAMRGMSSPGAQKITAGP
jgi:peroxiredoxin